MCDPTTAVNLGREAQRISADFTPERFFERLFAVIEEVVPQRGGILPLSGESGNTLAKGWPLRRR